MGQEYETERLRTRQKDGWTGWMGRRTGRRTTVQDGQTDGWTGGRIDRQKDNHVYVYVSAYFSFFDRWFIKNRY